MPPQGCDLVAPGDKLKALLLNDKKNLLLVAKVCKLLKVQSAKSELGYKNKHHLW